MEKMPLTEAQTHFLEHTSSQAQLLHAMEAFAVLLEQGIMCFSDGKIESAAQGKPDHSIAWS